MCTKSSFKKKWTLEVFPIQVRLIILTTFIVYKVRILNKDHLCVYFLRYWYEKITSCLNYQVRQFFFYLSAAMGKNIKKISYCLIICLIATAHWFNNRIGKPLLSGSSGSTLHSVLTSPDLVLPMRIFLSTVLDWSFQEKHAVKTIIRFRFDIFFRQCSISQLIHLCVCVCLSVCLLSQFAEVSFHAT